MPVSVDGELVYTNEIHISVERKALKFMLPKGVAPKAKTPEVATV
jgi:diacylglycerol kinase family enzyme